MFVDMITGRENLLQIKDALTKLTGMSKPTVLVVVKEPSPPLDFSPYPIRELYQVVASVVNEKPMHVEPYVSLAFRKNSNTTPNPISGHYACYLDKEAFDLRAPASTVFMLGTGFYELDNGDFQCMRYSNRFILENDFREILSKPIKREDLKPVVIRLMQESLALGKINSEHWLVGKVRDKADNDRDFFNKWTTDDIVCTDTYPKNKKE